MKRRAFILGLGGAAAAWPLPLSAQQSALPVIGFIGSNSYDKNLPSRRFRAFHEGLGEAGFFEGRNVAIEYRFAEDRLEQYQAIVADLVRRQVAVIASLGGTPVARALKAATATIPVVFQGGLDPVQLGLVASLARPGGNITGVVNLNVELGQKRLELMHELLPDAKVMALLVNPTHILAERQTRDLQDAARSFGLEIRVLHARDESEFEAAFARAAEQRVGGLVIANMSPFTIRTDLLGALAARYAVPAIHQSREFAAAGGLISYSGSSPDAFRRVGVYTGRVLKGEKPADLPVQQLTKVEMIVNLKAAKTLGITVSLPLAGRADEIIE
jgi:putative tryptophan/tyrosine transport system substrate-binding protein